MAAVLGQLSTSGSGQAAPLSSLTESDVGPNESADWFIGCIESVRRHCRLGSTLDMRSAVLQPRNMFVDA